MTLLQMSFIVLFFVSITGLGCGRLVYSRAPVFKETKTAFEPAKTIGNGITGRYLTQLFERYGVLYGAWITSSLSNPTISLYYSLNNGRDWKPGLLKMPGYSFHGVDGMDWPFSFYTSRDGNEIYLVCVSFDPDSILFSRLDDKGEVIYTAEVNDDHRKFTYLRNPSLSMDKEGGLYLFYTKTLAPSEIPDGKEDYSTCAVYLQRSMDEGMTWSNSLRLKGTEHTGYTMPPPLSACDKRGNLYLFSPPRLYRSRNGDETWRLIRRNMGTKMIGQNRLRMDRDGNLYLAWVRERVTDHMVLFDGGEKGYGEIGYTEVCLKRLGQKSRWWSSAIHINDTRLPFEYRSVLFNVTSFPEFQKHSLQVTKKAELLDMMIAEDPKAIAIIWKDWRLGEAHLFLSYSRDGGETWTKNIQVDVDGNVFPTDASIAISNKGIIYVLWLGGASERQYERTLYLSSARMED